MRQATVPEPPKTAPPQFPIPQTAPSPVPPIVQLECPLGTLFDSYTSQCTFLPESRESVGPPLVIHPDCTLGSTYSTQSEACVLVEANNDCPPGTYRDDYHRCISKLKYRLFRYGERLTLLAGNVVQAQPVPENYTIRVLEGSLRVFYLEDPASDENVVQRGLTQPLYNYAILSCVMCPATFVTHRMR